MTTMRASHGEADFPLVADLVRALPEATPHLVDLPWRISSPAFVTQEDTRLWEDQDGRLLAFACWQIYWACLDYYVRPHPRQHEIEDQIFTWALSRFRQLDEERGHRLPYWVEFREDDEERRAVVEAHGFHLDEDYHYCQMSHPLSDPLPVPQFPQGFSIRSLAGEQEVEAYVALHRTAFESTSMTTDWRLRTLHTPHYRSELDLVVVAPDGSLAGFCVGWLDPERQLGQIEPVGVHPNFHGMKLGTNMLRELLQRFKTLGAQSVLIEPESTRIPALRLYESVGFRTQHKVLLKGIWAS